MSDELLSTFLDEATDRAAFVSGRDGRGVRWNPSVERLFGYPEEPGRQLEAQAFLMPGEPLPPPGDPRHAWCQRADGSVFPADVTARESRDGSSLIWTFRDRSVQPVDREQERKFLSVLAHDLREPLNSVYGFTQLLIKKCASRLTPDEAQYLELVKTAAQRMNSMIVALQDLNRLDANPPEQASADVGNLVSEVENSLRDVLAEKRGRITRGPLPIVRGTPVQLAQLFTELITNAIRFGGSGGKIDISVSAKENGPRQWLFEVRDEGPAVDEERLEKIFMPFVRGGGSEAGRGLGLAVCRKIVERHGGRIWAEKGPERGLSVKFVWPR